MECNRSRGAAMHLETIPIPAAIPAASPATRTPTSPASLPLSFSATLASSMSSAAAEYSQGQCAPATAAANSGSEAGSEVKAELGKKFDAKLGASVVSKSSFTTAPCRGVNSGRSLNPLRNTLNPKSTAKVDAKPIINPVPDTELAAPPPLPITTGFLPVNTVASLLTGFGKSGFSASATVLILADPSSGPSSNGQPRSQQLTANPASLTEPSPQLPIPQPVGRPAQTVVAGKPPSSVTQAVPSPEHQPDGNHPIPAASSAFSGLPPAAVQAHPDAEHSFLDIPAQPLSALGPSSVPPLFVSQMPAGLVPPAPAPAVLPAAAQAALQTPPVPVIPAPASSKPIEQEGPSSLPGKSSDRPTTSSAQSASPPSTPAFNELPLRPSAPAPTLAPAQTPTPAPTGAPTLTLTPTSLPRVQFPVSDSNPLHGADPQTGKLPTATQAGDSLASSTPVNRPADPAAQPTPASGSATVDSAPAQAHPSDATTTAAQTDSSPETGFNAANNRSGDTADTIANIHDSSVASNVTASNRTALDLASNSNADAPAAASVAATASDGAISAKLGVPVQSTFAAASPTTAAEKKSSTAVQPNAIPLSANAASAAASSASAASATAAQGVPAAVASGKEISPTLTAPAPAAAAPPPQAGSDAAPELPQTHQMLDSAPPAPVAPNSAADAQMQMNAQTNAQASSQMHVGIRTEAFGSVEIHTVVQQSQVGITVQADREIVRWFSSEVPSLESGLNHNHLNLTAVNFDNGRSGVQTATGFQHGQPRQHFPETTGSPSGVLAGSLPEEDTALDSATVDLFPADVSVGLAQTHVSIHV